MGSTFSGRSYSGKGSTSPKPSSRNWLFEENVKNLDSHEKEKMQTNPDVLRIFAELENLEEVKTKANKSYKEYREASKEVSVIRERINKMISQLPSSKKDAFKKLMDEMDPIGSNIDDLDK